MLSPASSSIDVAHAGAGTPGCAHVAHFNNTGAALMPQQVLDAVSAHFQAEALTGGYEAANAAARAVEHGYGAVADRLGCHRDWVPGSPHAGVNPSRPSSRCGSTARSTSTTRR
jgi:hypothetical protein